MHLPSLNASSPLECLFKPEGRALAAGGGHEASFNKFQFVRIPLVPNDKCILREDDEICAGGGADGKGTCFGDEGLHDNISGTL